MVSEDMRARFALSLAFLGGLGCGDGGGEGPPGASTPVSDVTGTLVDIYVTETGDVASPKDPSLYEVAAVVAAEGGTTREILAIGAPDGSFRIPDVPEAPFDLRFTEAYGTGTLPPRIILNAPRKIDLGRVYLGRPDAATIVASPTELGITATGLSPWQSGDDLQLFSLGAAAVGSLVPTDGEFPAKDATELAGWRADASALQVPNLIDEASGDKAYILQLVSGGGGLFAPYRAARKVFAPDPFSLVDGGLAEVQGAFMDMPEKQFAPTIDEKAFQELTLAVNPAAAYAGKEIAITVEPGGDRASASVTPNLLTLANASTGGLPPSFTYGNPFPPEWSEVASVGYAYVVTHQAPTGITKQTVDSIGQSGPVSSFSGEIKPALGPPENVTINDQPAGPGLLGIGASPTVKWSAPSIGKAAVYVVTLRRLDPGGGTTRTIAFFSTTETSLRIPAEYLDFGYYYYLRIRARADWQADKPLRGNITSAYSSALTGVISP